MAATTGPGHLSPADRAIREAMDRGEFDDLPGAGKPLRDTGGTDWFVQRYLQTGDGANTGFLPPSLLLRREAEDLPERAARLRTEQAVRDLVTDLNTRIIDEVRMPSWGPPLVLRPFDVDEVLERWRADRQALADKQAADAEAVRAARRVSGPRRRGGLLRRWGRRGDRSGAP